MSDENSPRMEQLRTIFEQAARRAQKQGDPAARVFLRLSLAFNDLADIAQFVGPGLALTAAEREFKAAMDAAEDLSYKDTKAGDIFLSMADKMTKLNGPK